MDRKMLRDDQRERIEQLLPGYAGDRGVTAKDNWCFIEWPEKTPNLIPIDHASISIKILPNGKRELTLKN